MEFHEAADLFPLMQGRDFDGFKWDIQENGQLETIKTLGGKILDGRNRYLACKELGLTPRMEALSDDTDPIRYVMSLNDKRRHLSEKERTLIAAKATTMRQGERTDLWPIGQRSQPPISTAEAAEKMDVSERNVTRAKRILDPERVAPEVRQAVEEDRMSLGEAADRVAVLPMEEQRERARQATGEKRSSRKIIKQEEDEESNSEIDAEPNGESKPGVGLERGLKARTILMRIPLTDPLRNRGFQVVWEWLKQNYKRK